MTDYLVLRLRARHAALERDIERELATPLPDGIRIQEMKKEKLYVRDRLRSILRADDRYEARA
jgi:hypothetical protein